MKEAIVIKKAKHMLSGNCLAAAGSCYLSILFTCVAIVCHAGTLACSAMFLILTPVVFLDPRKEMRSSVYGLCWCVICFVFMLIILSASLYAVAGSLAVFGVLAAMAFYINRCIRKRNPVFRGEIHIGMSNTALFCRLYICIGLLFLAVIGMTFLPTWYEGTVYLFAGLMTAPGMALEWNRSITVVGKTIVVQNGKKRKNVPIDTIAEIRHIPFVGYQAKDEQGKFLFWFRASMQNVPGLIAAFPPRLRAQSIDRWKG